MEEDSKKSEINIEVDEAEMIALCEFLLSHRDSLGWSLQDYAIRLQMAAAIIGESCGVEVHAVRKMHS